MGVMMVFGPCWVCKIPFTFNADKVPSYSPTGRPSDREPICPTCLERVNEGRKANGLPEISVLPGAYEPEEVG